MFLGFVPWFLFVLVILCKVGGGGDGVVGEMGFSLSIGHSSSTGGRWWEKIWASGQG